MADSYDDAIDGLIGTAEAELINAHKAKAERIDRELLGRLAEISRLDMSPARVLAVTPEQAATYMEFMTHRGREWITDMARDLSLDPAIADAVTLGLSAYGAVMWNEGMTYGARHGSLWPAEREG